MVTYFFQTRNISRIYGKPKHPQTNNQVEKCNQTIKALLRNLTAENHGSTTR